MATEIEDQSCLLCRFFIEDGNRRTGECHRHPPVVRDHPSINSALHEGVWPKVGTDNWCGEFAERPDA